MYFLLTSSFLLLAYGSLRKEKTKAVSKEENAKARKGEEEGDSSEKAVPVVVTLFAILPMLRVARKLNQVK